MPEMAPAGYQQDRAKPDDMPASLSGHSPLKQSSFSSKAFVLDNACSGQGLFWTRPLLDKASSGQSLGKQKDRRRRSCCRYRGGWPRSLVANHLAVPVRETSPMPSSAAAGTGAGHHNDRSGNDDNGFATIRAASAHGTAVKARTASTLYLDDHVGGSLAWGQRHGLRGAAR
jgi:hypothetical protein